MERKYLQMGSLITQLSSVWQGCVIEKYCRDEKNQRSKNWYFLHTLGALPVFSTVRDHYPVLSIQSDKWSQNEPHDALIVTLLVVLLTQYGK